MIDLLLAEACTPDQLSLHLSRVFECSIERIKIFSIDEFNGLTEELDGSMLDCVCVHSRVLGDAAQLLQLYRYTVPNSDVVDRIIEIAIEQKFRCFIPVDQWDEWIYVNGQGEVTRVNQLEQDEEDCFRFVLSK
ncbi:hypothetical protein [Pseudoduganella sp. R-43]|jgi:hypothetical protein|uniref:hypothetical protein n=1 Tax=unclassified Pseudoduganella TaxID=2637179 RepID=UPI003CF44FF7